MDLTDIISISGKSGLYTIVGQSKNNVIVESLLDGKRFPTFSSNRISALKDISIYTYEGELLLSEVYRKIHEKENVRIQGSMQTFEKLSQKVSKRVLTLPKARSRREHSKSSGIIEIGLICVELRPFYCSIIILVPM